MSALGDGDAGDLPRGPKMLQLLTTGFAWSSVVWTGVVLGVFDALATESDPATLAHKLALPEASLRRLLGAIASVDLVEVFHDGASERYRLSALAAETLCSSAPHSIVPLVVQNQRQFYELFMHLPDAIRTGRPQLERWKFNRAGAASCYDALALQQREYSLLLDAMDAASAGVAEVVAQQADFTAVRHVVDLGHGGGRLTRDLLALYPDMRASALDLAPAIEIARARAEAAGVADRILFIGCDLREPLPALEPADAVILSGVLSDFEEPVRMQLLGGAYAALRPGGEILISETLFDEGRHGPPMPALLSLCMLLLTGGDNFAPSEVHAMLTSVGFEHVCVHRNGDRGVRDLVVARRPA
jgi:SAM-dependent methyltransferase